MHRARIGLVFGLTLLLSSCKLPGADEVSVTVIAAPANPPRVLDEVSAISGGDKFTWAQLRSGEKVEVDLSPGEASDVQVTLIYKADGARQYWESPRLPAGRRYEVIIEIDALARATGRACIDRCDSTTR